MIILEGVCIGTVWHGEVAIQKKQMPQACEHGGTDA